MKKSILLFIFVLGASTLFAQKQKVENSLLWEISGKKIKQPSYLFGTIHLICEGQYLWTDRMNDAFNATQQLYLELPMADKDFRTQLIRALELPKNISWEDYFTKDQYEKLDAYFRDSLQTLLPIFFALKPLAVISFTMQRLADCNGNTPVMYEQKLMELAQKNNVPVKGLETVAEQMSLFDNLPKDSVAKMLMGIVENATTAKLQMSRMQQYYKEQNLQKLMEEVSQSQELELSSPDNAFIDQRNKKWVPTIIAIAKNEPTFFAIGAGHLSGKNGLISLLRKKGYKVKPIK
ncbi:MAG: TraB/GumN family protein [Niabella sp.]